MLSRFRKTIMVFSLTVVVILALPRPVFSWGSGHDDVMRAIIARLPADLRNSFTPEIIKKAVLYASHYPDSFEPFLAEEIGEAAVKKLEQAKIKVRFDLHSERGSAMALIMLIDALREKHPAHTAHWIATLSHVIADMSACNHDPLVQTAGSRWVDWGLTMPGGASFARIKPLLDLSGTARDQAGGEGIFNQVIDSMRLSDDQRDAATALTEIMLYGEQGADYCSRHGVAILEGAVGWVDRQDEAGRRQLWQHMSQLGAWGVVRTLRDVDVAIRLAKTGEIVEITPEILAAARQGAERIRRERPLEEEALFASILREWMPGQAPAIGVVLEPTYRMNGAFLGYGSRLEATAIARTLQRRDESYVTLDARQLLEKGFPVPEEVPQLVIVAAGFHNYHEMQMKPFDDELANYLHRGGRVLWVMGTSKPPQKSFAAFHAALSHVDQSEVKKKLPVSDELFLGSVLNVVGTQAPAQTIAHRASYDASWTQPYCPWSFDLTGSSNLKPLVTLTSTAGSRVVGAVTRDGKVACIPIYALTPHLLKGEESIATPHEPLLDAATERILFATIRPGTKTEANRNTP